MEQPRHFVATCYVVADGAVALHPHDGLDLWLPPGGHVDRDELPHRTALREAREETGLEVALLADRRAFDAPTVEALPRPRTMLLEDINVHDGAVGHQHVDHVYFGTAPSREIEPADGEQPAAAWRWFDADALADADARPGPGEARLPEDVRTLGREAITSVAAADGRASRPQPAASGESSGRDGASPSATSDPT